MKTHFRYLGAAAVLSILLAAGFGLLFATTAEPADSVSQPTAAATSQRERLELLMDDYACTACHAVDRKVVGPAFAEVAAKYRGTDAAGAMASKIRDGSSGAWGPIPMPPNPQIPEQDLHKLVELVLGLK